MKTTHLKCLLIQTAWPDTNHTVFPSHTHSCLVWFDSRQPRSLVPQSQVGQENYLCRRRGLVGMPDCFWSAERSQTKPREHKHKKEEGGADWSAGGIPSPNDWVFVLQERTLYLSLNLSWTQQNDEFLQKKKKMWSQNAYMLPDLSQTGLYNTPFKKIKKTQTNKMIITWFSPHFSNMKWLQNWNLVKLIFGPGLCTKQELVTNWNRVTTYR